MGLPTLFSGARNSEHDEASGGKHTRPVITLSPQLRFELFASKLFIRSSTQPLPSVAFPRQTDELTILDLSAGSANLPSLLTSSPHNYPGGSEWLIQDL
jgi:hypothetical protein